MSINIYMLREYISLILEKRGVEEAQSLGLALMRVQSQLGPAFVLYDANKIISVIRDDPGAIGPDSILGMIVLGPRSGDCNNASEVKMVAAQGFGEMMYGIASQFAPNGILPDRTGTSTKAQGLWKNVLIPNASSSEPLDNEDEPVTPNTNDDCEIKHTDTKNFDIDNVHPLDKSYKFNSTVNTSQLESNHKKFIQMSGKAPKEIEELLYGLATRYFTSKLDFSSFFN
jgi:hypothetical protein